MKSKTFLLILILTVALAGCKTQVHQQPAAIEHSHPVYITGSVISIEPIDVDKSGKNPRIIPHFVVKVTRYDDGGWDTILGSEIKCVIKEGDLIKQSGRTLRRGDRILITSHITERSPKVIAAHTVEFLEQEQNNETIQ